ncbi:hypothetical protein TIFTF001_026192 [Ficus carica]|uniref:Uncharacterized protein n=1 Tax=Ficus carica TaxID=3494 RepID=A0AA88DKS6_FICCA|nr:hypothetical protein TIFTF001_026192 [Ficus carica]
MENGTQYKGLDGSGEGCTHSKGVSDLSTRALVMIRVFGVEWVVESVVVASTTRCEGCLVCDCGTTFSCIMLKFVR